jgi:hypothetical protein
MIPRMPKSTVPGQHQPEQLPPFVGPTERRAAPELSPLPPEKRVEPMIGSSLQIIGRRAQAGAIQQTP